jgi:glycosyltransferase involved in cell wall biosynthesis
MESVAVNIANLLAQRGIASSICSTRRSGPLQARLSQNVNYLNLERHGLVDCRALRRFIRFLQDQHVDVIHAHGTALFFCSLSTLFCTKPKLVWHDHFGRYATEERPSWLYRLAMRRVAGVIAVNEPLADWARSKLRVPATRVWYVPNFVIQSATAPEFPDLPGQPGKRIVCVANLRPEKGHLILIDALREVVTVEPQACVLIVGSDANRSHTTKIRERIHHHGLENHVFILGSRSDVSSILCACDIGVLPSISEGLPLALLEYGVAGLPAVATRIGQVPEVLDEGRAGILVPPGQAADLAAALIGLLESEDSRRKLGAVFRQRVQEHFSETAIIDQVLRVYENVLKGATPRALSSLTA